ncbi:uncharacterized protein KD926_007391 [Aspergillus affinis]|uniref:uncharacterized protein n=1 Tax=Aspergillus affinis TaxID=1070780 RepID=UPI0022FE7551|nr:uncharacterized protein KD926_007391 [Aspergillus affinis]KAI9041121.1 hypothetical protein KD926_007391 [Aspergillus affinis]
MNQHSIPVWVIVHVRREWTSRLNFYTLVLQALAEDLFEIETRPNSIIPGRVTGYIIPVRANGTTSISRQRSQFRKMAESIVYEYYQQARDEEYRQRHPSNSSHEPAGEYQACEIPAEAKIHDHGLQRVAFREARRAITKMLNEAVVQEEEAAERVMHEKLASAIADFW